MGFKYIIKIKQLFSLKDHTKKPYIWASLWDLDHASVQLCSYSWEWKKSWSWIWTKWIL